MAIGSKVKLGFDGSAVKAGLSRVKSQFAGLGKVVGRIGRQVAIGGARRGGETLFGLVMRAGQAIPREIGRLADYSAELQNVARDTKVTTAEILAMTKALELNGMDTDMAADAYRELATKMGEAAKEVDSEPMKALNDLGLFQPDIKGQSVQQQMKTLAQAVQGFGGTQQDLAFIMDRFLGGDLGLKAIGFFQNYNASMEEGRRLTAGFSNQLENSADGLRDVVRLRAVVAQKFSEFALGVFGGARGQLGSLVKRLETLDIASKGERFAMVIKKALTRIEENGGLVKMFKSSLTWLREEIYGMGQQFGQGIKDTMKDAFSPSSFFGLGGNKSKDRSTTFLDRIENHTERSTSLLERIERQKGAVYV